MLEEVLLNHFHLWGLMFVIAKIFLVCSKVISLVASSNLKINTCINVCLYVHRDDDDSTVQVILYEHIQIQTNGSLIIVSVESRTRK